MTPERLLEVSAVARQFAVTTQAVRNWIRAGKVSAVKTPSGRYRIAASTLKNLQRIQRTQSSPVSRRAL